MLLKDVQTLLRMSGRYIIRSELGEPCEHMVAFIDHMLENSLNGGK